MRDWLLKARRDRKMTMDSVAEAVGISRYAYFRFEHGQMNPSVATAKRIADCLGIDWTRFYDEVSA